MSRKEAKNSKPTSKKEITSTSSESFRSVADRVYNLIKRQKQTQAEVARETGVSKAAISNVVSTGNISLPTAIALSRHFKVSLDYLCGLSDYESQIIAALDLLSTQIKLSKEKTESGQSFFSAKISKPISGYLAALTQDSEEIPKYVIEFYQESERKALTTAIADKANQAEQDMKEYLIIERTCDPHSPAFGTALDEYLREKYVK